MLDSLPRIESHLDRESLNDQEIGNRVTNHVSSLEDLTVLVLTLNEERHIARCIESTRGIAERIVVVDSGSNDRTCEIAAGMGADVYSNAFINQSVQMNWAIDNTQINTTWIMRLDADEVITPPLRSSLKQVLLSAPLSIAGLTVNRQIHFLGKWIKHGGIYPIRMLRIWRTGKGRCENRWMDEHMLVDGGIQHLDADIADINLNSVTWWVAKHNQYSVREAIELLRSEMPIVQGRGDCATLSRQARIKRWVKSSLYSRLPLGLRSGAYFFYRYFLCLGFLDGWRGFVFCFLQGFWYRFLVDVKIYELKTAMTGKGLSLQEVVKQECGYDI